MLSEFGMQDHVKLSLLMITPIFFISYSQLISFLSIYLSEGRKGLQIQKGLIIQRA